MGFSSFMSVKSKAIFPKSDIEWNLCKRLYALNLTHSKSHNANEDVPAVFERKRLRDLKREGKKATMI